jgi:hypothetical protein
MMKVEVALLKLDLIRVDVAWLVHDLMVDEVLLRVGEVVWVVAAEFEVGLAHQLLHVLDVLLFLRVLDQRLEMDGLGLLSA